MNRKVSLTVATSDYDHVRDFRLGTVQAEGIEPTWLTMDIHEIFSRFTFHREWDISELSFAKFVAQVTKPDSDIIGLPVYMSRMFRFSSFYVNRKSGIKSPKDLRGKKIGVPEWAQTAAVYTRGWLQHDVGIPLTEIDWYQAGTHDKGRIEKVDLTLPPGLRLTRVMDKTLSDMIETGELDCVMIARPPRPFTRKHPDVVRLFPDYRGVEEDYFKATGVYPIMHGIAVKKSLLAQHPWIARNMFTAFEQAKNNSLDRLLENSISVYPLPWVTDHAEKMREMFKGDFFPYGIEANRPTLEMFLQYCFEQGIATRHAKPEEIFAPGCEVSVQV